jgi:hypothetical protein
MFLSMYSLNELFHDYDQQYFSDEDLQHLWSHVPLHVLYDLTTCRQ